MGHRSLTIFKIQLIFGVFFVVISFNRSFRLYCFVDFRSLKYPRKLDYKFCYSKSVFPIRNTVVGELNKSFENYFGGFLTFHSSLVSQIECIFVFFFQMKHKKRITSDLFMIFTSFITIMYGCTES